MKSLLLLLPLLLGATILTNSLAAEALARDWKPIPDVNAALIQEIAAFAVAEHNKQVNANLILHKVLKGEEANVVLDKHSAVLYKLTLVASTGTDESGAEYVAVVLDKVREHSRKLLRFKPIKG